MRIPAKHNTGHRALVQATLASLSPSPTLQLLSLLLLPCLHQVSFLPCPYASLPAGSSGTRHSPPTLVKVSRLKPRAELRAAPQDSAYCRVPQAATWAVTPHGSQRFTRGFARPDSHLAGAVCMTGQGVLKFTSTSQRRNQKFRREKSLERRHAVRAGTSAKRTASPSPALCRLLRGKRWCARTPGGPSRSPSRAHGPSPPTLGWLAAGPQLCPSLETPIGSRAWHTQGHAPSQRAARGQGLAACFDVEQVKGSPGSSPLPGTRGSGGPEGEASCCAGSSSPWAA